METSHNTTEISHNTTETSRNTTKLAQRIEISPNQWKQATTNVPSIFFFLQSKTFLYWADISVTSANIFFIPDLYSEHTNKCETFNFNLLFYLT